MKRTEGFLNANECATVYLSQQCSIDSRMTRSDLHIAPIPLDGVGLAETARSADREQ